MMMILITSSGTIFLDRASLGEDFQIAPPKTLWESLSYMHLHLTLILMTITTRCHPPWAIWYLYVLCKTIGRFLVSTPLYPTVDVLKVYMKDHSTSSSRHTRCTLNSTAVLPPHTTVLPPNDITVVPSVLHTGAQRYYRRGTVKLQSRYYHNWQRYYRWPI